MFFRNDTECLIGISTTGTTQMRLVSVFFIIHQFGCGKKRKILSGSSQTQTDNK